MRKLRKIFKYVGYTFLYLIVSLASAYGAITISSNITSKQDAEGQGVVPSQIQAIKDNFEKAENVDLNLNATINSGNLEENDYSSTSISVSAKINHEKAENNTHDTQTLSKILSNQNAQEKVNIDGIITIVMGGQSYEIRIAYLDNNLYFDALGGKFRVETTNLIESVKQVISMVGVTLPDIGSIVKNDKGEFDINKILSLLNDLNELKSHSQNVINLNIPIPDAPAIMQLITDKSYKLKQILFPLSKVSDTMSVEASGNVVYPKTVEIGKRNIAEYANLTPIIGVASKVIPFVKQDIISFDASVDYEGNTYDLAVSADIKNMQLMVETEYEGLKAKVIYKDKSVYLECENLFVKFSLNDLDKVGALLEKFGINLPIEQITSIIEKVTSGNALGALKDLNLNLEEFDLTKLNLDIFESIREENGTTTVVIKNIGTIDLTCEGDKLSAIGFDGFGVNAKLNIKSAKEIKLESEENYKDVALLLPLVSNVIDFAQNKNFTANILVKTGETEIPVEIAVSLENEFYAFAKTRFYGKEISVIVENNTLYINALSNKLKVSMDDKDTILEFVSKILGKDIKAPELSTTIDIAKIIDTVKTILDKEKNPLLLTSLKALDENKLEIGVMGYSLVVSTSANSISLETTVDDISISASVTGSNEAISKKEINAEEYTSIAEFIPIIESTMKIISDKIAYLEINGSYNDITLNGFININGKIEIDLTAHYENVTARVVLKDNVLYVKAGNIAVKLDTRELDSLEEFLSDNLNVEIPYLDKIMEVLESENMIDAIIALIPQDTNTQIDTTKLDIEELLANISLSISRNLITAGCFINGKDLSASINLGNDKISSIGVIYDTLTASVTLHDEAENIIVSSDDYVDAMALTGYIEKAMKFVNEGHIKALAEIIFLDNGQKVNASIEADYSSQIKLGAVLSSSDINGLDISFFVEEGVLYFNYNGLLLKIDNKAFGEILSIALEFLGIDPSTIPFLDKVDLDFNLKEEIGFDTGLDSIDPMKMIGYIDYISGIYTEGDNLVIALNGKRLYNNSDAKDIIVSFISTDESLTGIEIDNLYNSDRSRQISFKLDIKPWTGYTGVDKSKNYVDISCASDLIKALVNMVTTKDFHIAGTFNVNGKLAGIDLASAVKALGKNNVIPFDIRIKVVDKKPEIAIVLGEIPAVVEVNNDVPYEFGDTESGDNRFLYIYYKDDAIYFYRSETVDIMFGAGKRKYEKATKVSVDRLMEDFMYYVQYGIGFTDTIIDAMKESMALASNRTSPMDYSNILRPIEMVDANSFRVSINMAEIANNPQLGIMSVLFRTGKDRNDKNYVSHLEFAFDLPLKGDTVNLKLDSSNIDLVNYLDPVDMSALYDYVNSYTHGYDEEWEASKGNWSKSSEKIYTIKFNSNGGNGVSDISGSYKTPISLPTLPNIVTDNGIYKSTKVFDGWFTSEDFSEKTHFTSNTMPRRDLTLHAKWNETKIYYRTITFITNSAYSCDSITKLAGSDVTLFTLSDKEETLDGTTTYSHFDGWFTSADFNEESAYNLTSMPDYDVTLYAKWDVYKVESTVAFKLYHNDELLIEKQVKVGEKAEFTHDLVNESTKYYLDKDYNNEYTGTFEMHEDTTLYVRNKYNFSYSSAYGDATTKEFSLYEGEAMPTLPAQASYVNDDGNTRVTYTFNGYSENLTVAPDRDVDIVANWSVKTEHYYTVTFDLRWYIVLNTVAGSGWKDAPTAISPIKVLEGTTLNLNESKYIVQGRAYTSAVRPGKISDLSTKAYFKSTSWGTSQWNDYTKAGSGFTSYTVTGNVTLYACWEKV